jgi:hypothetical protein
MKKLTILAALMLAAPSANAAWYPWIDGENYVGRCLPVVRDFVKNDDLKRASNSEHMFCMAFAAAVAEVTDRACIPDSVLVMELVDVGASFIGNHFSYYRDKPAVSGLTDAFHAKWPCPGKD